MQNFRQNKTLDKITNKEYLENGYVILKDFLNIGVRKYLNGRTFRYLESPYHNGYKKGSGNGEHSRSWNTYAHETWEAVLEMVCPSVQQIVGTSLIPTYSYQRMYMNGSAMAHHSDRPACQISLTINLGQSHSWPIYCTSLKTKKYVEVVQEPGDALLYLGCNIGHYRPEYKGDWYNQLFLHYVIQDEINAPYYWDNGNQVQIQRQELRNVYMLDQSIPKLWKHILHKDGVMDNTPPYAMDEYNAEKYFPIDQYNGVGEHPFIQEGNLSKDQKITKEEYEFETKQELAIVEMEADPDDLPEIEDIHGNEYDPKKMSDEQHDFVEDDLPDGIEIG